MREEEVIAKINREIRRNEELVECSENMGWGGRRVVALDQIDFYKTIKKMLGLEK